MAHLEHNHLSLYSQLAAGFSTIPIPDDKCIVTYVWVDDTNERLRSKNRTFDFHPQKPADLPEWSFDGSSTGQATDASDSDVILRPAALYRDPFMLPGGYLVLCETFGSDLQPLRTNKRQRTGKLVERCQNLEPWFAFEQEYTLMERDCKILGWPKQGEPASQGPYYCAVGSGRVMGRELVDTHYRMCLYAGILIGGTNAEVLPGQWEYQIGPGCGLRVADDAWMARYILNRLAENFDLLINYHPKPIRGAWNGSGGHMNFSTKAMRADNGIEHIHAAIKQLALTHHTHLANYDNSGGVDNQLRLTGLHETGSFTKFSWGVASRSSSVRIPRQVALNKCGYLEDRRPSSDCDPYLVVGLLLQTVCLNETPADINIEHE